MRSCNSLGTGSSAYQTCSSTTFCNAATSPVSCTTDICSAAAPACDGETLAMCDSYGGSYVSQTTDCSSGGQVCNLTACADQAVDTVGSSSSAISSTSYRIANTYFVQTDRTLTQIEQYVSVSGTSQFTWFVYENTNQTGTYTKIFDSLNTASGSAVFQSSGVINVPLQAGRYYAIGVRVEGSAQFYRQSQTAATVSFGQRIGAYASSTSSGTLPDTWSLGTSNYVYHQRLTTE